MTTTAQAPTNIAILKYWGKNPQWEQYHIPLKSSLSFTVSGLFTKTTVQATTGTGQVSFALNGKPVTSADKEYEYVDDFMGKIGRMFPFIRQHDYRIVSENNFPSAAGFASSASGFAALVTAMVRELDGFSAVRTDDRLLSALARIGSGSAARSIPSPGGFVIWRRGIDPADPRTPDTVPEKERDQLLAGSFAETLLPPEHWPELRILYAKVETKEKKVRSRAGMKTTVQTNPFYPQWIAYEESQFLEPMIRLVKEKRFDRLADLMMKASNNLHAMCLSTSPPICYLNETSWDIILAVHELNAGGVKAAYTFDAGPNAVVFTLQRHEKEVRSLLADLVGGDNVYVTGMGPGPVYSDDHLI